MQYKALGKTGFNISPITFGGIIVMNETTHDADNYVAYAIERGINYFDVAPSYGNAEAMLGPALAPYRKQVYLACKTGKRDAKGAKQELEQSLCTLETDYFDVYQLHSMTTQDDLEQAFAADGSMGVLIRAKEQGLIRNIGITAHNEDIALEALKRYDFDTVMFPIQWALGLSRGMGDRLSDECRKSGKGLLALKSLAHRMWLDGEERIYPKSWCKTIFKDDQLALAAMRYSLSKGADTLVPPGNFEQFSFMLDHIGECLDRPLTQEDLQTLKNALPEAIAHPIFA